MSEPNIILAEFIERRDKVLLELGKRESSLVEQLTYLNAAIAGMEAESKRVIRTDEYSGFRKPSDALFAYLDRARRPQPRDEMCRALVDGGFRGTDDPYWDLVRAVYYQIKKKRLVERNGLIGKTGWPKELFVPESKEERPSPKT